MTKIWTFDKNKFSKSTSNTALAPIKSPLKAKIPKRKIFLERLLLVRQYDEINDGKRIIDENFYPTHSLYSVSFWDTDKGFSQHGGR